MFLFLPFCSAANKPIILIPGTYASVLTFDGSNNDLPWYCPKSLNNEIVWIAEKWFLPPVYNCLLSWVKLYYKDGKQSTLSGYNADVYDYGGIDGVTYLDRFVANISFIGYFSKFVKVLHDHGYQDGVDLYGSPNDWRFGICNQEVLWPRLKNLVETAYTNTGNKKVTLFGHSFGGFITHHFISQIATTYKGGWIDKYIDRGVEIAPSFGGAGTAVHYAIVRAFIFNGIEIKTKSVSDAMESMGAVHTHFPNVVLQKHHGNPPVIVAPDGEYTADKVIQALKDHGKINGDNQKLADLMSPYITDPPKKAACKEIIIYNSKISTEVGVNVGDWDNDKSISSIDGEGDGTVISSNIVAYCENIADKALTTCTDMEDSTKAGKHFGMLLDEGHLAEFYQATQ